MRSYKVSIAAILVLLTPVAVGCGGGDDNGDGGQAAAPSATATTAPPAASRALSIRMTEFAFDPNVAAAKKGKVTITASNDGKVVHELVLLKTDADPGKLPKLGDKVDESTSVGEIADVEPGSTKKATLKLTTGKYAMVCALPGHYEGGMYGTLTVE